MQVDFQNILREILYAQLTNLDIDVPMNYLRCSIEDLLGFKDKAERAKELLCIVERAEAKRNKVAKAVIKKSSSISVIRDVLKMRKFVVTWPHMKYESEKTSS
jgi:hypothetical protein